MVNCCCKCSNLINLDKLRHVFLIICELFSFTDMKRGECRYAKVS